MLSSAAGLVKASNALRSIRSDYHSRTSDGFSGTSGKIPKGNPSGLTLHSHTSDGFSGTSGKIPSNDSTRIKVPDFLLDDKGFKSIPGVPSGKPVVRRGSGSGGSGGSSAKQTLQYYEAPLAEYYGFGKETAYQEALANTAYRREINDMRKAGLNPSVIYGDHNTTGADTNAIPRSSGGGGGGGGGRRYRGSNSGKYLFSGGTYYGLMAGAAVATTAVTKNFGAGMAAAAITGTALKALNGFFKK